MKRPCRDCNEIFDPYSKFNRICEECKVKAHIKRYPHLEEKVKGRRWRF